MKSSRSVLGRCWENLDSPPVLCGEGVGKISQHRIVHPSCLSRANRLILPQPLALASVFAVRCWEWCWESKKGYDLFSRNPLKLLVGSTGLEPVAPAV